MSDFSIHCDQRNQSSLPSQDSSWNSRLVWSGSSCLCPLMHLTGQVEFLDVLFICLVDKWHLMTAGLFHYSISFFISSSLGHHPGTCGHCVFQLYGQAEQKEMQSHSLLSQSLIKLLKPLCFLQQFRPMKKHLFSREVLTTRTFCEDRSILYRCCPIRQPPASCGD